MRTGIECKLYVPKATYRRYCQGGCLIRTVRVIAEGLLEPRASSAVRLCVLREEVWFLVPSEWYAGVYEKSTA